MSIQMSQHYLRVFRNNRMQERVLKQWYIFDKWSAVKPSYICLLWICFSCIISPPVDFGAVCLSIQSRQLPCKASLYCAHSFWLEAGSQTWRSILKFSAPGFFLLSPVPGFTKGHGPLDFGSILWNAITVKWFCLISRLCISKCKIPPIFQGSFSKFSICHWPSTLLKRQNGTLLLINN